MIRLVIPLLFVAFTSFGQQPPGESRIVWDTYGVPHIYAEEAEDLFFMQGWAQMHNHANLILELYGSSRGRGAEYWGESKLQSDQLIHTLGFPELADAWEAVQEPELKKIFDAFVAGLNAYAKAHPEAIDPSNKAVLPIRVKDVNMHAMYVVFTRFIGGQDLGRVQRWPDMGSNTYAIGPKRSASGHAMLVQNPHLPWWNEFLFFESNLILGAKRMYGTTLVGFPGIAIGFNDDLGWSHTDNTIDNADTYELELTEGGYLLDGQPTAFETSSKILRVRQEDGTFSEIELPLLRSKHGPVVKQSDGKALAIRMVGTDRPNMFLQWWRMVNSRNLDEFEAALQMAQIPFWNVMYADRHGDIFYLFNGLVPKRAEDKWDYWDRVIPGGRSADIWTEVHPYEDLPKLKNPGTHWLQNANDPPWTSTIPMTLDPDDFPGYMAPQYMSFRPQRSARMLLEDESISFEELQGYKLSTRLELADRILDDLFEAVERYGSEKAHEAKDVLESWDRSADADSRGMLLFFTWARKFGPWRSQNYAVAWDPTTPNTTPDGLANPEDAVRMLEESAREIEAKFGRIDVAWGEYYRIAYAGKDLPANGVDGSLGVFRVAWPGNRDAEHMYVGGGDSWVGVIEFADEVRARVLLSYGNASQPDSPHFGDQLELFSRKELRDAWFTPEAIEANTARVERLADLPIPKRPKE